MMPKTFLLPNNLQVTVLVVECMCGHVGRLVEWSLHTHLCGTSCKEIFFHKGCTYTRNVCQYACIIHRNIELNFSND